MNKTHHEYLQANRQRTSAQRAKLSELNVRLDESANLLSLQQAEVRGANGAPRPFACTPLRREDERGRTPRKGGANEQIHS